MELCTNVFAYMCNVKCYHLILIAFLVYFNKSFFNLFVRIHEIITGTCILHKKNINQIYMYVENSLKY